MNEIIQTLQYYMGFPFVRNAIIVGLLIALCSSLLGVTLVLKRFSFIGDGLSHVAFGAMSVSTVISVVLKQASRGESAFAKFLEDTNGMVIILPVTLLAAILLLRTGQNTKIKGDAAIAMISVGSLALGYMLVNMYSASANVSGDVCSTLFGSTSILTLKDGEVKLCAVLAAVVITVFIIFYNRIFSVTFDENFAKASGVKSDGYNLLIAVITAMIIVLAMNLVGSLLISALIIFPALSAMRLFKSFKSVVICSAVISVLCAGIGMIASILYSTPVGSTIVTADIAVFLIFSIIAAVTKRN
ncbi:metal ABC transporter permease [Ruminococcus albus]|uniref:Zinc transport system permease protein n=1 Tax=Ruminococcus albus TaxID=1264 RepID=A0A1H7N7E0_RUMAL|nr:metal ABC transporter permease [Ruminococcus albus]SEL19199.1 zinc transport system permease protein [Ruminococcus albus]